MKSFLFFEIEKEMENLVFKKINNQNWRGVKLRLEIAKEFSPKPHIKKKKKNNF